MKNIYFIDYYKLTKNHGLDTYTYQLGSSIRTIENIKFTHVWLNSPFDKKENNHIYLKKILDVTVNEFDSKIASLLVDETREITQPIFHFNWINHLSIAHYLKKTTICSIILTKHCIPWRDMVTNHYPSFYNLNQAFERKISIQVQDHKMQKEMVGYVSIDHIITVTDCAKRSLTQLFKIEQNKVTKVFNGLAPEQIKPNFKGNKNKLRQKYGFCKDEQLIIYAGNINPRKGIFDVVAMINQLFTKHRRLRLIIAGPGNYVDILKTAKCALGKITICGSLDKQTLYDFYSMADVGIVPSYMEQCSYTCIEMMHSSLPIIVSDVDGLKEMVKDNCGLRIKVDFKKDKVQLNQKDLIANISYLLDNPKKAEQLAKRAKKYALKYFTAERMVKETVAVYEKVLAEKGIGREEFSADAILIKEQTSLLDGQSSLRSSPIVSIIIPCYNAEAYLQECLDSIYGQSFSDFEIIIFNDGSTDGTAKIIKEQNDVRIIYRENRKNLGIAYTLNNAIALAKGKYIARIDADDTMNLDRLRMQVAFMENNPAYGLVGSWHTLTDSHGLPFKCIQTPEDHDEISLNLMFYNPISHPTVMLCSQLAKANLYNVEFNRCEDYDLWFRLADKTKIKNLPKALVNYRIHQNSIVVQHQKEMQQNVMELLSNQLEKKGIIHSSEELALHCAICFDLGKRFFNTSDRINSLHEWLDKVFTSKTFSKTYKSTLLKKFRKNLIEKCCGM